MESVKNLEQKLFNYYFVSKNYNGLVSLWNIISKDDVTLSNAIKIEKRCNPSSNVVLGRIISEFILNYPEQVNKEIYLELVNLVLSDVDIARLAIYKCGCSSNSFLSLVLNNLELFLTEEQKEFVLEEYRNNHFGNINGLVCDGMIRGDYHFDLRYRILRNPNWTIEEKKRLVKDFFKNVEEFKEFLEQWEYEIVNNAANFKGGHFSQFDKLHMYHYTYDMLLKFYENKKITDEIWAEINFCREMTFMISMDWNNLEDVKRVRKQIITK